MRSLGHVIICNSSFVQVIFGSAQAELLQTRHETPSAQSPQQEPSRRQNLTAPGEPLTAHSLLDVRAKPPTEQLQAAASLMTTEQPLSFTLHKPLSTVPQQCITSSLHRPGSGRPPGLTQQATTSKHSRAPSLPFPNKAGPPRWLIDVSKGSQATSSRACRSRPDKGPGRAKKNGCGGKYTWVGRQALLDEADDPGSRELDAEDPNYDSDEQDLLLPRGHAEELQAYKQAVRPVCSVCRGWARAGEPAWQRPQRAGWDAGPTAHCRACDVLGSGGALRLRGWPPSRSRPCVPALRAGAAEGCACTVSWAVTLMASEACVGELSARQQLPCALSTSGCHCR